MTAAGLILAAGAGERFGGPKALAQLDGETFLARAVGMLTDAGCSPVLVVLGASSEDVLAQTGIDRSNVVIAADWQQGMSASLRAGLDAVATRELTAVVVALVDQPWVTTACVQRLIAAWEHGAVAAVATYAGKPRNPVLLGRDVWPDVIESLDGDSGARDWLRANPGSVVEVECGDIGDPRDVDYPGDLGAG